MYSYVRALSLVVVCWLSLSAALLEGQDKAVASKDKILFNFQDEASVKDWVPVEFVAKAPTDWVPVKLTESKQSPPSPQIDIVPDSKGGKSLKLTFNGGDWPAVGTTKVLVKAAEWKDFGTLKADLTVDRPSTAYFCIRMEKDGSRCAEQKIRRSFGLEKTMALVKGRNEISLRLQYGTEGAGIADPITRYMTVDRGEIAMFTIALFQPEKGQTLLVGNVRLSADKPFPINQRMCSGYYSVAEERDNQRTGKLPRYKVYGTDLELADSRNLGNVMLKDKWMKPEPKTIEQVEAEFKAEFQKIKETHPKAAMVLLREGDKGCDPANPEKLYAGWNIMYLSSHGWDGPGNRERENLDTVPRSKQTEVQCFYRWRGALMRADLSRIPKEATILAARLAVTRKLPGPKPPAGPSLFMAEPCNRDWDINVANSYFYAPGKRWKSFAGTYYGEDPDFLPILFPLGPGGTGAVSVWNFTDLVKWWVEGNHPNYGVCVHTCLTKPYFDNMLMCTGNAKDIKQRPLLAVIYEPK